MAYLTQQDGNIFVQNGNVFRYDDIITGSGSRLELTSTLNPSGVQFWPTAYANQNDGLTIDTARNRLFVCAYTDKKVYVLALSNLTLITVLNLTGNPSCVEVDYFNDKIYVCEHNNNRVIVLDADTLSQITTFSVNSPSGISVWDSGMFVVSSYGSNFLRTVNSSTFNKINEVSFSMPVNVFADKAGGRIFSCSRDTKAFTIFDSSLTVSYTATLGGPVGGCIFRITGDYIYYLRYQNTYLVYKTPYSSPIVGGETNTGLTVWNGLAVDKAHKRQFYIDKNAFFLGYFIS